jgi:NADH-quinone oxidoreductase subunit C
MGDKVLAVYEDQRGMVVRVEYRSILEALRLLRDDVEMPFNMLADEMGVDWLTWSERAGLQEQPGRFSVYYNLYSLKARQRIFVEIFINEGEKPPSAVSLFGSANWAERIIYDLFGVEFEDHPDLRRIYMAQDYEYFPLRKDFPRVGADPQDYPQE